MANALVKKIPNTITTLRMLLAIPICFFILNDYYVAALWTALIAAISDVVDGWLARLLDATTRYGAIVDPLSDKAMLSGAYACFALVGLLPWWVAVLVVGRDLIIVACALAYLARFGLYEVTPSSWGKLSTFVQILFALALLAQQVEPVFSTQLLLGLQYLLVFAAVTSSLHYAYVWGARALQQRKDGA